jgi:uncharacterized repeat protein (TIGR03803 family)
MFSLKSSGCLGRNSRCALAVLSLAAMSMALPRTASAQTLTTLTNLDGANGQDPYGNLFADANGNLFGTTLGGGTGGDGTVFEIAKSTSGYASTPTTLVNFNYVNGAEPLGALIEDSNGNLFGTTYTAGTGGAGTVFEIVKSASGYASTPTTLFNFSTGGASGSNPHGGLIADASGDLFGTTLLGGASGDGTVFEIVKSASGYASTPTVLVNFNGTNGANPYSGLIADANGDLFGTTNGGGALGEGTVFEIVKSASGYASTPTTLVSFNLANGAIPWAGLIDANGNLFGTTLSGGTSGVGTVFEIVKTSSGYASTPTTLLNFNGTNGANPYAGLIADANGDLFGTTYGGGSSGDGTAFEIVKSASGYASTATTLVSFNGTNGANPYAGLIADTSGDLFGTTSADGASGDGTVFELTGSGFVSPFIPFAEFQADLAITTRQPYAYALVAEFSTSAANTAINAATEAVTLQIANYTATIPAGSFKALGSTYLFNGTINGVTIDAVLTPLGGNKYAFAAIGSPENLSTTTNPVTVSLAIGTNVGSSQVNAALVP